MNMKKISIQLFSLLAVLALTVSSCKKWDIKPEVDQTSETIYANANGYKTVLAKVYGSFATTGNAGPAGAGDLANIDEGTSDYLRLFWKAQELSTDEAVVAWGDPGIRDFHNMNWSSSNPMLEGLYNRIFYSITIANEFIREAADDRLARRGISGADATTVKTFKAEARFMRAYAYWAALDLFGNVPFIDDASPIGATPPRQIKRADLYNYIVTELRAVEADLPAARSNEYGRADKAAAWALLARLYLNAGVYTGTPDYNNAIVYSKRVIDAGYTLVSDYRHLMLADNQLNVNEFILTLNYDGQRTQNWGGTTFLTHASVGGDMNAAASGINGGWGGIRTTKNIPALFSDVSGNTDSRAQFFQHNLDIADIANFKDGYAITKYRNVNRLGVRPANFVNWVDIDFPLFRLAEMYLIYAEAVVRGGAGGDINTAVTYINNLRQRAHAQTSNQTQANINSGQLTLNFILDERARELYWEGHRRTDLIRYGRFTEGTYLWPWKGGVAAGTAVPDFRKLYPLPSSDIVANPNLVQNPNY